jgi:hypothetical protein
LKANQRATYSVTTNQAAIIALFRVINRYVGNLPPVPGVFPDFPAPMIRNTSDLPRSRYQLTAPVLVMVLCEVGSTVRADVAMAVMLGLRLPDVVFSREWKLLRRCGDRRRVGGLHVHQRELGSCGQRKTVALLGRNQSSVEIAFGAGRRRIMSRVAEGRARRNHQCGKPNRRRSGEDFRPRHLYSDQPA